MCELARRAAAALAVLGSVLVAEPGLAAGLVLEGTWGNAAGCKFAKEGQSEDDGFVVLKADTLESYGTGCDWVQVFPGKNNAQVAIGLCGFEGEDGLGAETFVIAPDRADPTLLKMYTGTGEVWAELRKCP